MILFFGIWLKEKKILKKNVKKPYDFKHAEWPGLLSLWICFPVLKWVSLLGSEEQLPWDCSMLLQSCTKRVGQERDVGQKPGVSHFKGHLMGNGFTFFLRKWSDEQFTALLVVLSSETVLCMWKSKWMVLPYICCGVPIKWTTSHNKFKMTIRPASLPGPIGSRWESS